MQSQRSRIAASGQNVGERLVEVAEGGDDDADVFAASDVAERGLERDHGSALDEPEERGGRADD